MNRQTNYELFYNTIETLSSSQGYYGRLLESLNSADDVERDDLIESLPNFKDTVDVILFIEQ